MRRLREWWRNPRLPISPITWLRVSWLLLFTTMIGWPVSAMTVASGEPQVVLFLSWFAIWLGALANLIAGEVRAHQDD